MVTDALAGKGPSGGKASGGLSASGTLQKDFRVELAKTGASKCRVCEDKIAKASCMIITIEVSRAQLDGHHFLFLLRCRDVYDASKKKEMMLT